MKYTMSQNNATITLDTVTGKICGNTYQMRAMIKEDFPGAKWNKEEKCWEYAGIESRIEEFRAYFTRCYNLAADVTEAAEAPETVETTDAPAIRNHSKPAKTATAHDAVISRITGLCPRCGTYCYGDCSFR